jgi:hypothetical protein
MSVLKSILSADFVLVDKELVKQLGNVKAAFLLAFLKEKEQKPSGEIIDGYFPLTVEEVQAEIGLTYREQAACIEILTNNNLIHSCRLGGLPCKRHFKLIK